MTEPKQKYRRSRKKSVMPSATEHQEQSAFVEWFRYQFPDIVLFANPNGGKRPISTARRLKKEGTLAGVPDLTICAATAKFHGLFIEMKSEDGRASKNQIEIAGKLEAAGYCVRFCWGWDEARAAVLDYLRCEK